MIFSFSSFVLISAFSTASRACSITNSCQYWLFGSSCVNTCTNCCKTPIGKAPEPHAGSKILQLNVAFINAFF